MGVEVAEEIAALKMRVKAIEAHGRVTEKPLTSLNDTGNSEKASHISGNSAEIRNAALNLLALREHSKHELVAKLSRKFSNTQAIEQQTELLAEQGLQSDERFVESFIRAKKANGKGPTFIKQELRRRGISEYLTAAYVYENDDDWKELAELVYQKKFADTKVSDVKEKSRRIRFMVSRGFSPEMVFRLLDK